MEVVIIILAGFLLTCGFYLILRRNMTRALIGLLFLGQAANLVILALPGLGSGGSAIIPGNETELAASAPDPLPQALILTAIVIGFGVVAFALVLLKKAYRDLETDDLDSLNNTDR